MEHTEKTELLSLDPNELAEWMLSAGEPKYRAKQLFPQLHRGLSPEDMTNLGKRLQEKLREAFIWHLPAVERKLVSAIDGTVKYLFSLRDGNCVESVVMRYQHGTTICISSQVGCRMGCAFCASTIGGKVRDLLPSEMLGQIIVASRDLGERIDGVVMMGIGEPLDNYDNVLRFLSLITDEQGQNMSMRHISLSTCGVVPGIYDLMEKDLQLTLSVSLHAPSDEIRSSMMPVNRKWNVDELLTACRKYTDKTRRRISFEYAMVSGVNDSDDCARLLAKKLKGILCHVNLIPVNEVKETGCKRSSRERIDSFSHILEKSGFAVTVRRKLGSDIDASCGQLRRSNKKQ